MKNRVTTQNNNVSKFMEVFAPFAQHSDRSSYAAINRNRQAVLKACIEGRVSFDEDDFARLHAEYGGGHWLGADPSRWYSLAVNQHHLSACRAWERYYEVRPYIFMRQRLAPGLALFWEGQNTEITSINDERIIACVHDERGYRSSGVKKVTRRFRITRDDLKTRQSEIAEFIRLAQSDVRHELSQHYSDVRDQAEQVHVPCVRRKVVNAVNILGDSIPLFDNLVYTPDVGYVINGQRSFGSEAKVNAYIAMWYKTLRQYVSEQEELETVNSVKDRLSSANRPAHGPQSVL